MRAHKPVPTAQELEIMKIVWDRGNATVRDVYEDLLKRRRIAYTTVMTMMGILEQKGRLKKESSERAFVYRPTEPKSRVVRGMVKEFVDRVFSGSAKPLLVHLVENNDIDAVEVEELRRIVSAKRRKK